MEPRSQLLAAVVGGPVNNGRVKLTHTERLQEALGRYNRAKEIAATAEGAVAEAYEEKEDATQALTACMKSVVRYAEIAVGQDRGEIEEHRLDWSDDWFYGQYTGRYVQR